jgi:three-Cys-motif partner protein
VRTPVAAGERERTVAKIRKEMSELDPTDGLPRAVVGAWARDKHRMLARYVRMSGAARAGWPRGGCAFVDLFCGPGRARVEPDGEVIDGSALVAAREANGLQPFATIHVGDLDSNFLGACETRLHTAGFANVITHHGPAVDTAARVAEALPRNALHLALLDPFNLGNLPFAIFSQLAALPRIDLLIHFSVMDFRRNLETFIRNDDPKLERVFPGWKSAIRTAMGVQEKRDALFAHWCGLLESLGYREVRANARSISRDRGGDLYWLVLASRHPLGNKFWDAAAHIDPQRQLI